MFRLQTNTVHSVVWRLHWDAKAARVRLDREEQDFQCLSRR